MRSGDPGPDRPRARRESPDLVTFATRSVPARRELLRSFLLLPAGIRGTTLLLAFFGNMPVLLGIDLPRCEMPVLFVFAVRLALCLPNGIGSALYALVSLGIHRQLPQTSPPAA